MQARYQKAEANETMSSLISAVWKSRLFDRLSSTGLTVGLVFFALSLTPSLIPRSVLIQGAVSGVSLLAGYGLGAGCVVIWKFLEIPLVEGKLRARISAVAIGLATAFAALWLYRTSEWQNSIRELMNMEPVQTAGPFTVCLIAVAVFLFCLAISRCFDMTRMEIQKRLALVVPPRVSLVFGVTIALGVFWLVGNGLIFRSALDGMDNIFRALDEIVEIKIADTDAQRQQSKLDWNKLGSAGRNYLALGPNAEQIEQVISRPAMKPIRVYVGMRSAETAKERAQLALEELIRLGGFERSVLVVATPTGTGWMDPAAFDTMEYLRGGDVATVAMQYSYLASWLSLLVEPDNGLVSARALFQAVYQYWTKLPRDDRPELYLFGLSLGAHNSERSASLLQIMSDPIHGAVWTGPPFVNTIWNSITAARDEGSPAWLPTYQDGKIFRFRNQYSDPPAQDKPWGAMRIEYLQYASDPIVFFETTSFYLEPDWMRTPRGRDVSPEFAWYPVVTGLQLLIDMMIATTTKVGHGHVYHPAHYLNSWIEVTGQNGLSAETVDKIKEAVSKSLAEQTK